MKREIRTVTAVFLMVLGWSAVNAQQNVARIGVLAFRGEETARAEWQPLAQYLTETVDGWLFEILPVTLVSAPEAIKTNQLDFLITNPGHYVTLAPDFGFGPLATREKPDQDQASGLTRYGTAIFARRDSGIQTLDDLRGKTVAAVSPEAFGGFQLAWQEFSQQGIDPFADFKSLRFMGFPQDAIIEAVKNSDVDAGIVRSGLLESLASEGGVDLTDFVVLQNNSQLDYPHMVSGQLVPEWPFTAAPGIDKSLREAVSQALLATQIAGVAADFSLGHVWTAPLSYEGVRALTNAYHTRKKDLPDWVYLAFGGAGVLLVIWMIFWRRPQIAPETARPVAEIPKVKDPESAKTLARFETLTKREAEVLALICQGFPSKEIASRLGVSLKTIEYHRANLLQKTKAGTTAHLVQMATRLDVI